MLLHLRILITAVVLFFLATAEGSVAANVRIATFNIQNLSVNKLADDQVRRYLASVIRKFDIVAVQEVSDVSGRVSDILLEEVNRTGRLYAYVLSDRTGKQADDQSSQEQYAFFYDTARVSALDEGSIFNDRRHDRFQREPFTAQFSVGEAGWTVALTTIHTRPEDAVAEIDALAEVYAAVLRKYPSEARHLILGDFNGDCSYASPADLDVMAIRDARFKWIVPDDADTNLAPGSACAYDRIVADEGLFDDYRRWGIADWFTDRRMSDHWPVWATFNIDAP